MTDRSDSLDQLLAEAIREERDRVRPSSFDDDWSAAQRLAANPEPTLNAWQGVAAFAVVALVVAGIVLLSPTDDSVPLRETAVAEDVDPPVVWYSTTWYSTTDALLDVQSLEYTAQPARLTAYDPITLEVIP